MKSKFKFLLLIFIKVHLLTLTSCVEDENDLKSQNCDDSCVTLNGLISTGNGSEPLDGASLEVIWDNAGAYGGTNRLKARSETNENGFYEIGFELREDELEEGFFRIQIAVPDPYLQHCFDRGYYEFAVSDLTNDTIVTTNYGIPLKTTLLVRATGAANMGENDRFSVGITSPFGIGFSSGCGSGNLISWTNDTPEQTFSLDVAAEQPVTIRINITKDGQRTIKTDTLYFDVGKTAEFTAEFP